MKIHTWLNILLKFFLHPIQFIKFLKLPRNYLDLDEWLEVDKKKSKIVAEVIGCKNVESIKRQQEENMRYRKSLTNSFTEWIEKLSKQDKHSNTINAIAEKYARQKLCHRKYDGKSAGVWCYCR